VTSEGGSNDVGGALIVSGSLKEEMKGEEMIDMRYVVALPRE
jgi:hypothetical protein